MPITYPRPCPTCGTKINNWSNFSCHKKYCGKKIDPVPCPHCESTFTRKDDMLRHVRKFHSEGAKRKAEANEELARMELLHSNKVPRLSDESQQGGAVTTRGTKRANEVDSKPEAKSQKPFVSETTNDTTEEYGGGPNPLFVADVKKLGPAKRWKNNAVVNQKFIMTLDQQREQKPNGDLNIGATHATAVATDNPIDELKIPEDYWMKLQIGSRQHRREGLTGETWKIPVGDFTQRAQLTQALLTELSLVLNSGEFITNDVGFSASVLFSRPERKGGKRAGAAPGQKIWEHMAKESKCVCEIKNKDTLCCARAIVTMREYAKRQAGQDNTFENYSSRSGEEFTTAQRSQKAPSRSRCTRRFMWFRRSKPIPRVRGTKRF